MIYVIGPPGAGKTTLIEELIATHEDYVTLSTGQIAASMASTNNEVRDALADGKLAPKQLMDDLLFTMFCRQTFPIDLPSKSFIDGFPRYLEQLLDVLILPGVKYILHVDTPLSVCGRRYWRRAQDPDTPTYHQMHTWKGRSEQYDEETAPMIHWIQRRAVWAMQNGVFQYHRTDTSRMLSLVHEFILHHTADLLPPLRLRISE